jgi:hypothetical protein
MNMTRQFSTVIKEIIVGFGFLNGLWFALGTSPETEILGFINRYVNLMPEILQKLLWAIPFILMAGTIITIISIYRRGRILGIIAVVLAFLSGAIVLKYWKISLIILLISIIIGLIGFRQKKK